MLPPKVLPSSQVEKTWEVNRSSQEPLAKQQKAVNEQETGRDTWQGPCDQNHTHQIHDQETKESESQRTWEENKRGGKGESNDVRIPFCLNQYDRSINNLSIIKMKWIINRLFAQLSNSIALLDFIIFKIQIIFKSRESWLISTKLLY